MKKITQESNHRLKKLLASEELFDSKYESFHSQAQEANQELGTSKSNISLVKFFKSLVVKLSNIITTSFNKKNESRLRFFGVFVGLVTLAAAVFIMQLISSIQRGSSDPSVQGVAVGVAVPRAQPDFSTLKSPGIENLLYDADVKVASYSDRISGKQAVISQQAITAEQQDDDLFLLEVAQSFNLQLEFQTEKGPLYLGENSKQQVQTAIFKYKKILVFIQLQGIVDPSVIIDYADLLE